MEVGTVAAFRGKRRQYDLQNVFSQDPQIMFKYQRASGAASEALRYLIEQSAPGQSATLLCQNTMQLIETALASVPGDFECGLAFPICININNVARNFSPLPSDDVILKAGDVVKIELGVHVDGYIGMVAHTLILTPTPQMPVTGRAADVVCAAYVAMEALIREIRPGSQTLELQAIVSRTAKLYNCNPVVNTFSSQMKRFILFGEKFVANGEGKEKYIGYTVEENDVLAINILMSTGQGKATNSADSKPKIAQRDPNVNHPLRLKASRAVFSEVDRHFTVFPFRSHELGGSAGVSMGMQECLKHGLFRIFPVVEEKTTELVAHFQATVAILPSGTVRLTMPMKPPHVHSKHSIPADPELARILSQPDAPFMN